MALKLTTLALTIGLLIALPAHGDGHGELDFGDNSSGWADDGECDDPRFEGEGAANYNDDVDAFRDAADCEALFEAGEITLIAGAPLTRPPLRIDGIQFGEDTSQWAKDGECDDPRFAGEGMAAEPLDVFDAYADRTDCLALWEKGALTYNAMWRATMDPPPTAAEIDAVDFGADASTWANDGECDDPRFEGRGMAAEPIAEDVEADATDCRQLFMMGMVRLREK
ncbi:MAG: hypothetical protein AAGH87_01370 [Pseudomonadota bacterium]